MMTNVCEVCDELRSENDRLLSKLLIVNNSINTLQKYRVYLLDICRRFDSQLDDKYKQEINDLENYYKQFNQNKNLDNNQIKDENHHLIIDNNIRDKDKDIATAFSHNQEIESSSDESQENIQLIRNSLLQRLSMFNMNSSHQTVETNVLNEKKVEVEVNNNNIVLKSIKTEPNVSQKKIKVSVNSNDVLKSIKSEPNVSNNEKKTTNEVKRKRNKKTSSSNKARYKCDYNNCSFKAHIKRLVSDHINAIHTGERPYVCSFADCGKAYASLCYLNKHKLHVHSNQRFKCEWNGCQVEVKSRKSLKVHMRRHTGEKTFDCDFPGCEFRGTNIFSINDHKNKHTGEKPYKCKYDSCGAFFSYRSTRFTHYVRAHSDVRRFSCDWPGCESAFKDNQALRLHKCIHTGEKSMICEWPGCDYRCSNSSLLKKHKLVHTQEKKYVCSWPECDMKYSSLSSLKIHLMKHRGEKPNECETCGKRFREKNNLKRHYRTHNKSNQKA